MMIRLNVDAAFDHQRGGAGIGVVGPNREFVAAGATVATNTQDGEAWALMRGLQILVSRDAPPGSTIITDNLNVLEQVLNGGSIRGVNPALMDRIRQVITGRGYHLDWVPRERNRGADTTSKLALRIWQAGASMGASWGVDPL